MLCAAVWLLVGFGAPKGGLFLVCTALVSLGSAIVDGLVDGRVARASTTARHATSVRYICECGAFCGGLLGIFSWLLALDTPTVLCVTALSWASVAPCQFASNLDSCTVRHSDRGTMELLRRGMTSAGTVLVCLFGFLACLSPTLDLFLFRQKVLGFSAAQQSLVSVAGSLGWFMGTSVYRHFLSRRFPLNRVIPMCLCFWPLSCLFTAVVVMPIPGAGAAVLLVAAEKLLAQFCITMTYMPCTVLMQLHATKGCESTAFTAMQLSGTLGQVLSRNLEYLVMTLFGVNPAHSSGFHGFWHVALTAAIWRVATAVALLRWLVPRLAEADRTQ